MGSVRGRLGVDLVNVGEIWGICRNFVRKGMVRKGGPAYGVIGHDIGSALEVPEERCYLSAVLLSFWRDLREVLRRLAVMSCGCSFLA